MKDWNRITVLAGLALLFIGLAIFLPRLDFFTFLRPLRHGFPWMVIVVIWAFFWCCCGRWRGCCRRRSRREESSTEDDL